MELKTERLEEVSKLLRQTAFKFWKRSYHVSRYVFHSIEDTMQVGWVRLLESKKGCELLSNTEGNAGLICHIAKRGMQDYVRSVLGREGKDSAKSLKLTTTYYMDYYENDQGDLMDIPIEHATVSIEQQVIEKQIMSELDEFMRKRLSRRDKLIMDYLYREGKTAREITKKFSMTESRISQIRSKCIDELRSKYGS